MKTYMVTFLLCIGAGVLASSNAKLPRKILSMYSGFCLSRSNMETFEKTYLAPMGKAKFNVCDLKLHSLHKLSDLELNLKLKKLGSLINKHGMVFTAYTYAHPRSRNPKMHANLSAYVDENGRTVPGKFSLIHYEVWSTMFKNAFRLAKASKTVPIAAVKFDIEIINTNAISYDDQSWQKFAKEKKLPYDIPASKRFTYLQKKKMQKEYEKWFYQQYEKIAERLGKELHAINPHLSLGVMPFSKQIARAFAKKFGTKHAPVIIDHWCMYNGNGFDSTVTKSQKQIKALASNILYIPWFRINSYRPEFITCSAYHAASTCDGYSSWVGAMLAKQTKKIQPVYRLPAGTKYEQYYAAYKKANTAVLKDLKSNSKTATLIPMKKIKPLVAKLNLQDIKIPQLTAVGTGRGKAKTLVLRNQQIIYFNAGSGESIKFEITHRAGKKRPLALQYIIFDSDKNILRNEAVSPGEKTVFNIIFPKKGTGALVISGGEAGQAWYSVKIHSSHIGLLAEKNAYFFRGASFYVLPSKNNKDYIEIKLGPRSQCGQISINDIQKNISNNKAYRFVLNNSKAIRVDIYKRKKMPKGFYFQDIFVKVKSDSPYLSDGPERLLAAPPQN